MRVRDILLFRAIARQNVLPVGMSIPTCGDFFSYFTLLYWSYRQLPLPSLQKEENSMPTNKKQTSPSATSKEKLTPAQSHVAAIAAEVIEFKQRLLPNQEMYFQLLSGNCPCLFFNSIYAVGYDLIALEGVNNGKLCRLIQHVSQVNFYLVVVDCDPDVKRNPIGFHIGHVLDT